VLLPGAAVRVAEDLRTRAGLSLSYDAIAGGVRALIRIRRASPLVSSSLRPIAGRLPALNYSITLSAPASSDAGTSRPSALAVVTFMARSNLVGCCTGRSVGLVPRSILST
jgi:hypothetical protein